jgi:aminoglycoside 6-adenylyltransferase
MHPYYAETVQILTNWCHNQTSIHAAILLGSQVREDLPGDEWSDLDVLLLVDDPQVYMQDINWLTVLGDVSCTILEETPLPWVQLTWQVIRVLFSDQRAVDFSIMPYARMADVLRMNTEIHANGFQVIHDSQPHHISAAIRASLDGWQFPLSQPPTPAQVQKAIDELLFHLVYAAKKIRRGELWVAVSCINKVINQRLLQLVEFYTACYPSPQQHICYEGRFLEQRVPAQALQKLHQCQAKYHAQNAVLAMQHILSTSRWLAMEIFDQLGVNYSPARFDQIQRMLDDMFSTPEYN